ncbi:biotin transporter BioY [Paracoccus sp. 1_MG-2023]|uniref:biotin transporter BioY n=1 Tax=unclassified Paracoccus (in: a-proteobacteria) TaxID=2688777 RepID=UPI001C0993B2|nr:MULTISPECIES: biotin transporter BioY [unclassified Paracoccus (in: a-proteobacteria)]MBU2958257.1 biotin transporter BioY [Paracoccus sp. C2R09]MDO6668384.1 biotin transporter BioY [Paracoccus sp. 1_MG-2023]
MLLAKGNAATDSLTGKVAITLAAAVLIAIGAKVQVPFWPVPMTLQTLAVLVIAAGLGPRLGLAAMGAYMAAGLAGLPVFAGSPERGVGLAYLAGPTTGFLIGMAVSMVVTGALAQGRGLAMRALAMTAGTVAIYACGLIWLSAFVPADRLIAVGVMPFLLGDFVKIGVGAMLIEAAGRLRR